MGMRPILTPPAPPSITVTLPPLKPGAAYLVRARFQSLKTIASPVQRAGAWSPVLRIVT